MGLIEVASNNSVWRGINYYENRNVQSWIKSGDSTYEGIVSGSEGNAYSVHIDTLHPRKSTCNCPFAVGRRVVCKHMLAVYFTAEPHVAMDFMKQVEEWEIEEDEREQQAFMEIRQYVYSLSMTELQEQLCSALMELEDRWRNNW